MFASFECDLFPIGASYSSVSFLGTSFTDVKDETTLRKKIIRLKKPGSNTFPRSTTPLICLQWHLWLKKKERNRKFVDATEYILCNLYNCWTVAARPPFERKKKRKKNSSLVKQKRLYRIIMSSLYIPSPPNIISSHWRSCDNASFFTLWKRKEKRRKNINTLCRWNGVVIHHWFIIIIFSKYPRRCLHVCVNVCVCVFLLERLAFSLSSLLHPPPPSSLSNLSSPINSVSLHYPHNMSE